MAVRGSNNPFPSVLVVEGTTPTTPASGKQRLFVRSSDGRLCLVDDAAVVTVLGDLLAPAGTVTDNALVRFDATTGRLVQASVVIAQDDGRLSTVTDPSSAQDAATKAYVDALALNLGKRARVRGATTANVTIATALNNGDTIDGLTLVTGDLILVKSQTAPEENGVYVVGVSPARFAEFDTYNEHPGSLIAVQEGSANADTLWLCTSNVGGTLNTTAIAFSQLVVTSATVQNRTRQITVVIDGGGAVITTGLKAFVSCPFTGTITGARLLSSDGSGPATSGSIVVDIWKDTYANYPPTVADTITASAKPTLTSATKSDDTTLTGWTTSVTAGDVFGFKVDTVTSLLRVTLQLTIVLT